MGILILGLRNFLGFLPLQTIYLFEPHLIETPFRPAGRRDRSAGRRAQGSGWTDAQIWIAGAAHF